MDFINLQQYSISSGDILMGNIVDFGFYNLNPDKKNALSILSHQNTTKSFSLISNPFTKQHLFYSQQHST